MLRGAIPGFIVAAPSTYICIRYKLPWCLPCSMGAKLGMHSPCDDAANDAHAALQRWYIMQDYLPLDTVYFRRAFAHRAGPPTF